MIRVRYLIELVLKGPEEVRTMTWTLPSYEAISLSSEVTMYRYSK